jgi:Fur family transcriptional regulator, ferric uptake regulator
MPKKIEEFVKKPSFRVTKARSELLNILTKATKPLCYDDLDLNMDKATFYRNIAVFEEEKLVNKFESEDRKWYFEIIKNLHAHFICRTCKIIECVEPVKVELKGYIVENVILKGICSNCAFKSTELVTF